MPSAVVSTEKASRRETEKILHWRFDQLRRSGYSEQHAALLADRCDVDLHIATNLLGAGCPPETALRILL